MNILFGSLTAAERPFGLNAEPRKGNSPPALQTPSIWPGPLARRAQAPSGRLISAGSTIFGALSLTVPSNRIASGKRSNLNSCLIPVISEIPSELQITKSLQTGKLTAARSVGEASLSGYDNSQPFDSPEILVAAHQCRVECKSGGRNPEIIFIQRQTLSLASDLDGGVEIAGPGRYGLALESIQKLMASLLQLHSPLTRWKAGNSKENFAADDGAGDDTVLYVQIAHPLLNSRISPHHFADGIRIQQVCH